MRLNQAIVTERENFVYSIVSETPTLSAKEAMAMLKDKYGKTMSPDRFYSIYHAATRGKTLPKAVTTEERKVLATKRALKRAAKAGLVVDAKPELPASNSVITAQPDIIDVDFMPTVLDNVGETATQETA